MNKRYGLNDIIQFGQYEPHQRTIKWIIRHDPQYLDWCLENVEGFELSDEADWELELAFDKDW